LTSTDAREKRAAFAALLRSGEFIVAPGVYDMISAKMADGMGFRALYMSGYGVAASHLGLPDAGLASFADVLERARVLASGTRTPLICDADTGFGGLLNVRHTIRGLEAAGCAAVQLEDQVDPKKCGYTAGREVVALDDMLTKIGVALEARKDENLLLIARTDARSSLGLDEAIARGRAYASVGADVVFIQGPESVAEIERIASAIEVPLLLNLGHGGKTPVLPAERLAAIGYRIAIYPGIPMLAAAAALESVYSVLARDGHSSAVPAPRYDLDAMHRLMGFEDVWAFEERWGRDGES
jgi:2-methylisocitrate lyase-like PEP mutase family enzyme